MTTFKQIIYHIVFSTKDRLREIQSANQEPLYRFIWGVIRKKNAHLYRIGGTEDHIHILSSLHPSEPLANFVRDIKTSASRWMRNGPSKNFVGWQDGYGAFTHSMADKDRLIEYIKNQEQHHRVISFRDEFKALLKEAGIEFDEEYLP